MMIAQFLFVPIGGTLVSVNPWIPMFFSSAATVLGFLSALIFLPETLPPTRSGIHNGATPEVHRDPSAGHTPDVATAKHDLPHHWQSFRSALVRVRQWVRGNARLVLVLTCFFLCSVGQQAGGSLLLQYASKRLDWSLGKVSIVRAIPDRLQFSKANLYPQGFVSHFPRCGNQPNCPRYRHPRSFEFLVMAPEFARNSQR